MTEETVNYEEPKKGKWFGLFLKILFCIIAGLIVVFTVLANLGGSSDTLKKSIEEFVSENSAYNAKVGKLNNMNFFPDIIVDFENTEFFRKGDLDVVMTAQKIQVAFSFWDVMGRTGKIKKLNIEGFRAAPETLMEKGVQIDSLAIVDGETGPRMESKGMIGNQAFSASYGMESSGLGAGRKYSFGHDRELGITLGDVSLKGRMKDTSAHTMIFEDIDLEFKGKPAATGNILLSREADVINATGDLEIKEHGTDIKPDVDLHMQSQGIGINKVEGALSSAQFNTKDFVTGSAYDGVMTAVENIFGATEASEAINLELDAGTLYRGDMSVGEYKGPLPLKGWRIDADALKVSP